jgi:hypothetical protein
MRNLYATIPAFFLIGLAVPSSTYAAPPQQGEHDRSELPDSFKYYGPNGLWWKWTADQKIGRDTWFFYTGGTQRFYRILSQFGGQSGISIDFFRLLATKPEDRFRKIGLINEPNFEGKVEDEYGFIVDAWKGDPVPGAYPSDPPHYGMPTGVVGLRKFPNPAFTAAMDAAWKKDKKASVRNYFANPGKAEPPYIVGITCGLCHVAFDPLNPPSDPVKPRWENLAANMGNQYLREGDLFFGAGRIVGGDANHDPNQPDDPYATAGLDPSSFLYQYGHTQQPGTSETSRFSYDFINNPNTINQIFNIGNRASFYETTPTGVKQITNHVLKDGADSIGIHAALLRVYINIGSEGDYWSDHLWNPATGTTQTPFSIDEVRLAAGLITPLDDAAKARKAELLKAYSQLGQEWKETEHRVPFLVSYLASYTPYMLASIMEADGKTPKYISKDQSQLSRGALAFADKCAYCHSNKQPFYPLTSEDDRKRFFRELVPSDIFLAGNTLSDDVRYPFNYPGMNINAARSLATNAIDGDIWANFSSKDYKALPPVGFVKLTNPFGPGGAPMTTEFVAPGGGRGYYRTAALNSMWATAPYLHNNSVGRPPYLDPDSQASVVDPKAITVEGRIAMFEDGMDQLLNPAKRRPMIKVTSADSSLTKGMPGVERMITTALVGAANNAVEDVIRTIVEDEFAKSGLPLGSKPTLVGAIDDLVGRLKSDFGRPQTIVSDIASFNREIGAKIDGYIKSIILEKLQANPAIAKLLTSIQARIEQEIVGVVQRVAGAIASKFTIPKGTPLNLILNLNIGKAPYALGAYLKNSNNPGALAKSLIELSGCPDLVENHGHTYGSELSDADKRALIEYLKTL